MAASSSDHRVTESNMTKGREYISRPVTMTIYWYPLSKREASGDLTPIKWEYFHITEIDSEEEEYAMVYTIALDRESGRLWDVLTNKKPLKSQLKTESMIILSEDRVRKRFIKNFTKLPHSTRSKS